ncbi:MAG: Abi family protein [Ruminococcaceae bacterium]|nr:Abi family protein [Oscillospiraceae bacterium]
MAAKIPATINEQIAKMKERGCIFGDEKKARETLKYINYYRISNYFEPFSISKHRYEEGTTFEKVMQIYEMDRKLRSVLIAALEEIEIALRAAVSNFHALKYGATGYLNPSSFDRSHNHQGFMGRVKYLIECNDEREFVKHYNSKYGGNFPLWVVMELFSFGTLAFFFKDMQSADKKALANDYYGCSASDLDNWIFCLNELRNYCAHYNRLYGNRFPVLPRTPRGIEPELSDDVFGYIMVMKQLYHDKKNWNERIVKPISRMLKKNAGAVRLDDLGFPENWAELLTFSDIDEE